MIGYLRTRVRKQLIIAIYFESENEPQGQVFWSFTHSDNIIMSVGVG